MHGCVFGKYLGHLESGSDIACIRRVRIRVTYAKDEHVPSRRLGRFFDEKVEQITRG